MRQNDITNSHLSSKAIASKLTLTFLAHHLWETQDCMSCNSSSWKHSLQILYLPSLTGRANFQKPTKKAGRRKKEMKRFACHPKSCSYKKFVTYTPSWTAYLDVPRSHNPNISKLVCTGPTKYNRSYH